MVRLLLSRCWLPLLAIGGAACASTTAQDAGAAPNRVVAPPASTAHEDRAAWAKQEGLFLKQFDLNRDGEPDVFKFYREVPDPKNPGNQLEQLARKDLDINHDGTIDIVRFYNESGQTTEERVDLDFDGRFDSIVYFKDGVMVRQEIDLTFDGKPEITKYYDGGKLSRIESDRRGKGRVDTWEYFVDGALDRVGTDGDGDGNVDDWKRREAVEAQAATTGAAPSPPVPSPLETAPATPGGP